MSKFQTPSPSLRTLLLGVTGALAIILISVVALDFAAGAHRLSEITHLRDAARLTRQFTNATDNLAAERNIAMALLAQPQQDDIEPRLLTARQETDTSFESALDALDSSNHARAAEWRAVVSRRIEAVRALRTDIDAALQQPLARRSDDLAKRWSASVAAVFRDNDAQWQIYVEPYARIDAVASQQFRFNKALQNIVDYSGRERATVMQMLAQHKRPEVSQLTDLAHSEGVLETSWNGAQVLARQSGLYLKIHSELDSARSQYDAMHGIMSSLYLEGPVVARGQKPIAASQWAELSDQAVIRLDALRAAASTAVDAYIDELLSKTRRQMMEHVASLIIALLLCGLGVWIILRRVIAPINAIIAALSSAAQGNSVEFTSAHAHADEIGQLANVLHGFQAKIRGVLAERNAGEQRLRAVVNNAVDGIITIDSAGAIQSFNPACERTFGYSAEQVIGRNINILMPDPYKTEHDGYLHRYAGDGASRAIGQAGRVLMAQRADGSVFPIDLSVSAFMTPEGKYFTGILLDITARRQAEEKLSLLASVVESSDDAIVSKTLAGVITSWNKGAEHLFGYTAEEAIGQHIGILIPDDRTGEERAIIDHIRNGNKLEHLETERRRKDGELVSISVTISPIRDGSGHVVGASKIARNISARKLQEKVLADYMRALERSNKELDDFAYIASHDLKEPLRGIHNHARFLMEDNQTRLEEESVNRLNRLLYLSQRMERLVNDLLYFSRLGRQEFAIQQTDLNEVISDIAATLDVFLSDNSALIETPQTLPVITCDKTRVTEVFRNLITNAVKYNENADKRVIIGVAHDKEMPSGGIADMAFYVRDNGCGIAPEFHQEIFRIFKRLQGKRSTQDGTGVGLTFVKKIVERHGGRIWVESTPGEGSTFYFTLEAHHDDTGISRRAA